jgi:hypothetical protein
MGELVSVGKNLNVLLLVVVVVVVLVYVVVVVVVVTHVTAAVPNQSHVFCIAPFQRLLSVLTISLSFIVTL